MWMLRPLDGFRNLPGYGWTAYVRFGLEVLLVLALVALAVVLIVRALRPRKPVPGPMGAGAPPPPPPPPAVESALRILNERYAKGEIDDEAYRKMKAQILAP